jgi:hypothetical protein
MMDNFRALDTRIDNLQQSLRTYASHIDVCDKKVEQFYTKMSKEISSASH